jgi:hypothetical protein
MRQALTDVFVVGDLNVVHLEVGGDALHGKHPEIPAKIRLEVLDLRTVKFWRMRS